jgi:hypothetical protein
MAVIEGGVSGSLAGVGAESMLPLHTLRAAVPVGSGGAFRAGLTSGTMAASLAANAELFQFRYVTSNSRLALVYKVSISAAASVAAGAAALLGFKLTAARAWTVAGSAGTRVTFAGNNNKLRTSLGTSEVNDVGISTTTGLGVGTKTLDSTDIGGVAIAVSAAAATVQVDLNLLPKTALLDADGEGQYPLVLANQEGFVIRNGGNAWPAGMTWHFTAEVLWLEVPAF